MCDFCDNIITRSEYKEIFDRDWWEACGTYLIKEDDNSISVFVAVDDWYYDHNAITNVKYCPCCGRSLIDVD